MNDRNYHVRISGRQGLWDLDLRELRQYSDLIILLSKRDLSLRYKQTILGPLWLIINPILTALTYVLIFKQVAKIPTEGVPAILFYLVSSAAWSFFQSTLEQCSKTFISNANIFGKVYFPRIVVPLSYLLTCFIELLSRLVLLVPFCIYFVLKEGLQIPFMTWLYLPFIILWLAMLGVGIGIAVCALTAKYRDLNILISFALRLWMYATPVVYPLSALADGQLKTLVLLNPLSAPVELFRKVLLGIGNVPLPYVVISLLFTLVLAAGGLILFTKTEKNFMDTV